MLACEKEFLHFGREVLTCCMLKHTCKIAIKGLVVPLMSFKPVCSLIPTLTLTPPLNIALLGGGVGHAQGKKKTRYEQD